MRHQNSLNAASTVLVIVDMQEAFRGVISDFTELAARIALVAHAAQSLNLPVIATEQYPKGLGHTANEIRTVLPRDTEPLEKMSFSACGSSEFMALLTSTDAAPDAQQVLLCGVETHICVNQTAHDLLARGHQVHLLLDCISSRYIEDKQTALAKMQQSGVLPTTIEMALFELLRDARHEQFKIIQKLIK
ncbi:MAG: hydrolase [Pyrinomonadaceae bacterium]